MLLQGVSKLLYYPCLLKEFRPVSQACKSVINSAATAVLSSVPPLSVFVEFPRQQVKAVYSCVVLLQPAPILLMSSAEAQLFPCL